MPFNMLIKPLVMPSHYGICRVVTEYVELLRSTFCVAYLHLRVSKTVHTRYAYIEFVIQICIVLIASTCILYI